MLHTQKRNQALNLKCAVIKLHDLDAATHNFKTDQYFTQSFFILSAVFSSGILIEQILTIDKIHS